MDSVDKLTTWVLTMVTLGGIAIGTMATLGYLTARGKIRINIDATQQSVNKK